MTGWPTASLVVGMDFSSFEFWLHRGRVQPSWAGPLVPNGDRVEVQWALPVPGTVAEDGWRRDAGAPDLSGM